MTVPGVGHVWFRSMLDIWHVGDPSSGGLFVARCTGRPAGYTLASTLRQTGDHVCADCKRWADTHDPLGKPLEDGQGVLPF